MKKYTLLPFYFTRIEGKEVLINELGDMLIVHEGTASKIIDRTIDDEDIYKTLVANFFISEKI